MIRYIGFVLWMATWFYLGMKVAGAAVHPIELQEVKVNAKHFLRNGHDPLLTEGSVQNKELNLSIDTDIFKYAYWNNRVWSLWDQHQVRWFGLNFQFGARILPFLDAEYGHFSRHTADKQYYYQRGTGHRFPVEDTLGINLYLYRKQPKETLISW